MTQITHNGVKTYDESETLARDVNKEAGKDKEQLLSVGKTQINIQEATDNILSNKKYDSYDIDFEGVDKYYQNIISKNLQVNNYSQFANDRVGDALLSLRMIGSRNTDKTRSSFSYICYIIGNLIDNNQIPKETNIIESNYIAILKEMVDDLNSEKVKKAIGENVAMDLLKKVNELKSNLYKKV